MYLHHDLVKYFSASQPLFDQLMALRGESFRHVKGRLTQRVQLGEKTYFIKQHTGVGWKEILKNLIQFKLPVLSAKNEWCAIEKLQAIGVAVPNVIAYGSRGKNPAKQQSFVLMQDLTPTISLEHLCADWKKTPPAFAFKRKLIAEVARIARLVHQCGMNHRDFYICHFLLDLAQKDKLQLYLIDLHRAQLRRATPVRWIIKDLAGLFFSSKDIGLTRNDLFYFMKIYSEKSLSKELHKHFWQKVKVRGEQLYNDHS